MLHADCAEGLTLTIEDVSCAGGSVAAAHVGACQCECSAIGIGAPSRPGAIRTQTGLQSWIEAAGPCDQTDVSIVLEPDCVAFTSELSTATVLDAQNQQGNDWTAVPLMGSPGAGCAALATSVTAGGSSVSHSGNFDSVFGDIVSRSVVVTK